MAPAIDFEGSGAVQYLRPEIINPPAIHRLLDDLPEFIAQANVVPLSELLVLTQPSTAEFDARKTLHLVQSVIRSDQSIVDPKDVDAAAASLRRLRERERESIEDWANRLSRDMSSHTD
jgi:hypothetical protein